MNIKKTWPAPEDTVFARVNLLVSLGESGCPSCTYASRKYETKSYTF
ncbi:hypothetical protein [Desulfosporosinus sp. OT]|nr:hypothetical protein [Desulfosporosinus sp. OT]EGW37421.1 hypothetical protein DOT_4405 [Desulfosporosinus sp. OT]